MFYRGNIILIYIVPFHIKNMNNSLEMERKSFLKKFEFIYTFNLKINLCCSI